MNPRSLWENRLRPMARSLWEPRSRPIVLYGGAFGLLVISAYLEFEGNTRSSLPFVWSGMGVALVSLLLAVASVLLPER